MINTNDDKVTDSIKIADALRAVLTSELNKRGLGVRGHALFHLIATASALSCPPSIKGDDVTPPNIEAMVDEMLLLGPAGVFFLLRDLAIALRQILEEEYPKAGNA